MVLCFYVFVLMCTIAGMTEEKEKKKKKKEKSSSGSSIALDSSSLVFLKEHGLPIIHGDIVHHGIEFLAINRFFWRVSNGV